MIQPLPEQRFDTDFCVVGGGMAGVCAALAAARNGARTVLVQDRPVLGGNASSEIRMWVCGAHGADNREAGILEELQLDNIYRNPRLVYSVWDHVLYGKCLEQGNLTVLLNCAVHDVEIAADERAIVAVKAWHLTQQCYVRITAKLFADCSGDSVLRASGAEYRSGRESRDEFDESHAPEQADSKTMGNSILIQLRETGQHIPFVPPDWAHTYTEADLPNRRLTVGDNFWWLEVGGVDDTITDADAIRDELLRIAYGVWALIKNHPDGRGRGWELDWIGSLPGKRENVRFVGDHVLTQNDVEAEGKFDDIVAYGGWSMDDHHPDAINHPGKPTVFHPAPSPYGIPFRSLYSRNIGNLLFAGRNISTTHMAMSSTRVMATCAIMGQAVGTAAAIAVANSLTPRTLCHRQIAELQTVLMDQDCYLPWRSRSMPELCARATLTASTGDPNVLTNGVERNLDGVDNGWWGEPNDNLTYSWLEPVVAGRVRIVFDSDFSKFKRMLCRYPKDQPLATLPDVLARDFDVEICGGTTWHTIHEIRDNHRRLVTLDLPREPIKACRLSLRSAWGGDRMHVFGFDLT